MSDALAAALLAQQRRGTDPTEASRRYGQMLLQQGMSTAPVRSPMEGVARALTGAIGGFFEGQSERDQKTRQAKTSEKLGRMLTAKTPDEIAAIAKEDGGDSDLLGPILGQMVTQKMADERKRAQGQEAGNVFAAAYAPAAAAPAGGGNAANAIAGIESAGQPNGGYGAVGPVANDKGNRAYGKYQVMDFNVGPWTQEILGRPMTPQEFLANPQAQDAVFQAKFGQYTQQYGSPEAAARAWFAGPGGMNNPGAADVNGMTVQGYGQKFAQAYGPGATGAAPPQAPPVTVQAAPRQPGAGGLTIDIPQGSADASDNPAPVQPPQPQPPNVPRPQPTPQQIARYQGLVANGQLTVAQAQKALDDDLDRQWGVDRENAGRQYDASRRTFEDERKRAADQAEHDRRKALDAAEHDRREGTKPMNDTQALAASFADRMQEAEAVVKGLPSSVQTSGQGSLVGNIPLIGGWAANQARSPDYQRYQQAKDNFINAQLRKESGAAIGKDEYAAADRQYFPQPGDSEAVIAQKARNRQLAIEGMARGAGQTYRLKAGGEEEGAPNAAQNGIPQPKSRAEYDQLPPGAQYVAPDGSTRTKGGG